MYILKKCGINSVNNRWSLIKKYLTDDVMDGVHPHRGVGLLTLCVCLQDRLHCQL